MEKKLLISKLFSDLFKSSRLREILRIKLYEIEFFFTNKNPVLLAKYIYTFQRQNEFRTFRFLRSIVSDKNNKWKKDEERWHWYEEKFRKWSIVPGSLSLIVAGCFGQINMNGMYKIHPFDLLLFEVFVMYTFFLQLKLGYFLMYLIPCAKYQAVIFFDCQTQHDIANLENPT